MSATPSPTTTRKPWYRKWWIWAIIAAVLIAGAISNMAKGERDAAAPAATTSAAATPTADASVPAEPEAAESASPAPIDGPSNESRAAEFTASLTSAMGGQTPAQVLASDPSLWYGWVNGVRVDGPRAYVTLQVGSDDPGRDDLGGRAASALSTLLPASAVDGIDWIIVEDASGVVIAQKQPNPLS